jgi:photosystem II stability/assembly factor-like uncharacterized protein
MNRAPILLLVLAAVPLAGCGNAKKPGPDPSQLSERLVDHSQKPPFVNSLEVDPTNGQFMLTTNKGFFRIDPKSKKVDQVKGSIEADGKKDTVGTFLEIEAVGGGKLLGSGHPDNQNTLPQFLGFLESDDNGKSWKVLSRLGDADLHKIITLHSKLYAFDAVLNAMLISGDGGRTFEERFTPPGLVIDFVVDPDDADYLLIANEEQLFKSENGGERWRPLTQGLGMRLAWPAGGPIVRADNDGTVYNSTDKGGTWQQVGKVDGEAYKFETTDDPKHLYLALSDGTITETLDSGKTWKVVFKP